MRCVSVSSQAVATTIAATVAVAVRPVATIDGAPIGAVRGEKELLDGR